MSAWPPYITGILLGSMHIPLMLSIGEALGGSSSFQVVLAQFMVGPLKDLSPFIMKFQWGFKRWWQVWYLFIYLILILALCKIQCIWRSYSVTFNREVHE